MQSRKLPAEILAALRACRTHFIAAALFSVAINVLYLALPIYTSQVYDRVLSSGNMATLVMLSIAFVFAIAALAGLEGVRARVLNRGGMRLDALLSRRVVAASVEQSLIAPMLQRAQPLRELDSFRSLVTGTGLTALLDMPWAVLFLAVLFVIHPAIGGAAVLCAAVLLALAVLNEYVSRKPLADSALAATRSYAFAEASLKNAEIIHASGMIDGLLDRWRKDRNRMLQAQTTAVDQGSSVLSGIRFVRFSAQALVLGIGAYLAIDRTITPGAMFAASILLGRAMQPIEQVVGLWRQLIAAKQALYNVSALLATRPPRRPAISPAEPTGQLSVEEVVFVPPGTTRMVINKVSFALAPGEALGLVGPSAAGKSTLARLLVGVSPPTAGVVRLDGANVWTWDRNAFGRHVGYLPQDVELFPGTIAENIARFGSLLPEEVVRASNLAGAHEMILRLPNGYETEVGDQGALLSAGQRQQIALARAVYGAPRFVVLDEPNSNLDSNGEAALLECLSRLKNMGSTVVVISHRMAALNAVDKLLFIDAGVVKGFGPRQEVMARLAPAPARTAVAGHR
ncbi:MAG TPA: type I secretion system permease/ATPase [Burkholderiales bacterium]|nr:type I secretion system permease/ATPase [Burkholderiales bacterium]